MFSGIAYGNIFEKILEGVEHGQKKLKSSFFQVFWLRDEKFEIQKYEKFTKKFCVKLPFGVISKTH